MEVTEHQMLELVPHNEALGGSGELTAPHFGLLRAEFSELSSGSESSDLRAQLWIGVRFQ
jgi:hypothetical protein